ncbi:hypothetical protein [Microlunatus flavus]|uniref:Sap, sulfolipid-1-addressing protein n=1 Tax=Microlunatus flavus TaxID=1036181 RepID=A0A1H9J6U6_9ACTN|nr:hypothetical protein [Microlunatus flavus]SEQ82335.1 hypothetical protein SAMN05421756_106103 [Microlunatus flavus]
MTPLELTGAGWHLGVLLGKVGLLLGLGVVMASSPTTAGVEVSVLGVRAGARRRVVVIVAAIWTVSLLLALLLTAVSPNTLHALWTGRVEPVVAQRWFDVAVGVALVLFAVRRWRAARHPRTPKPPDRLDRPGVLATVVGLNCLVSTTGPATMYLVVRTVGTMPLLLWPVGYLAFLVGAALPYVVLAVLLVRVPRLESALSRRLTAFGRLDLRRPEAVAVAALGLGLTGWALVRSVTG